MFSRLRKLTTSLVLALAAALLLGACADNSHTKVTTGTYAGESGQNAPYLNVGPLTYEVQLSRQLNPTNSEDAGYLVGLKPAELALATGEEWFGVFMQVYNTTSNYLPSSNDFSISDTQGNVYTPLPAPVGNPYAYRPGLVPGLGQDSRGRDPRGEGVDQSRFAVLAGPDDQHQIAPEERLQGLGQLDPGVLLGGKVVQVLGGVQHRRKALGGGGHGHRISMGARNRLRT